MGYEIFYDKRFIKVKDGIIPLVQSGSNNCWQVSYPRDIPEKNWMVLNYPYSKRIIFTKEELQDIYVNNDAYKETTHKSRYKIFKEGEFVKWLLAGIKNAMTIEEHLKLGNTLIFEYTTIDENNKRESKQNAFKSEEELYLIMEYINTQKVDRVTIGFSNRNINKPKRKRIYKEKPKLEEFYLIKYKDQSAYLYKLKRYGFSFTRYPEYGKKFETQAKAQKYLENYWDRLNDFYVYKYEPVKTQCKTTNEIPNKEAM